MADHSKALAHYAALAAQAEEAQQPETWWWLSFAENGFRGAVIVRASGLLDAVSQTHRRGINPGGEVLGVEDVLAATPPHPSWTYVLLTREEAEGATPERLQEPR